METLISKNILKKFIIEELESDQTLFENQLKYFVTHLHELRKTGEDPAKMIFLAHKIRSGCQIFGALKLMQILTQIEALKNSNSQKAIKILFLSATALIEPTLLTINSTANEIFAEVKLSA